jgi:hypothetical protein
MKRGFRILAGNLFACVIVALALPPSFAQDGQESKLDAAQAYWDVTGFSEMMDNTIIELAKNYPAENREAFVVVMRKTVDYERIAKIGVDAVAEVFSLEEIEALTVFYDSELGQSVLKKMPKFLGRVQPAVQAEILRSIGELTKEQ